MYFYFLIKGECVVSVSDQSKGKTVSFLKEGCHFGEVALLTEWSRTASVSANNYITLAKMDAPSFYEMIEKFP